MIKNILLGLFTLFLLSGCAKFLEKFSRLSGTGTVVTFAAKRSGLSSFSDLNGGIMVYATRTSDNYRLALKLDNELDNKEVVLPNGEYSILALGWPSAAMQGTPRCGLGGPPNGSPGATVQLTGTAVTIPITLSAASCDTDAFSHADFRNAGSFIQPNFVFCGGAATISGLNSGSICNNGKESYRFFIGNISGSSIGEVEYDPVSKRVLYQANAHSNGITELYSVDLSGKNTVMQNNPMVSGRQVKDFFPIPGTNQVIYLADEGTTGVFELYRSTIGQPGGVKISGAIAGGLTSPGVKEFDISADGNYVVFVGQMTNDSKEELFSVNLSNLSRVTISNAAPAGTGVTDYGAGYFGFRISPNSDRVVFSGTFNSAVHHELYSVGIASAAPIKISPATAPGATAMQLNHFEFNYDGSKVVWEGTYTANSLYEVFAAIANTANSSVLLSGAVVNGTNSENFVLAPNADIVAFAADSTGNAGIYDLLTVNFSNLGALVSTEEHNNPGAGHDFADFVFNSDGTKLTYLFDTDSAGPTAFAAYTVLVGGADSPVNLSQTNYTAEITPISNSSYYNHLILGNSAYFRSPSSDSGGNTWIHEASLTSPGAATTIFSAGQASEIGAGLSKLFFFAGTSLYFHSPGDPSATIINSDVTFDSIIGIKVPDGGFTFDPYPRGFLIEAQANAVARNEIFFKPDYSTTSAVTKLSRLHDSASGVGRYKVRLLAFQGNPNAIASTSTAGLESECMAPPGIDGDATVLTSFFPLGTINANSLFVSAVDVYPESLDCTGSFQRILFPNGMANPASSPQSSRVYLGSAPQAARIFVKD